MYSQDKINAALQVYDQWGAVTDTISVLGYPDHHTDRSVIRSERPPFSVACSG